MTLELNPLELGYLVKAIEELKRQIIDTSSEEHDDEEKKIKIQQYIKDIEDLECKLKIKYERFMNNKKKKCKKENEEIIIKRIGLVFRGEYNSNKCICCQTEIENVEEENMTINLTDKYGKEKSIVIPVCDDCKFYVVSLITK